MPSNDAHFSGEGHLIEAEISGDVNNTIRPVVCDAAGRLLVDLSGTVVDIGIVQIEDSTGNPIVSTGGALNENLTAVGGAPITEGQKTMANSIPVVIASDQTPIPVTGSFTGTSAVNLIQIDGTAASVNNGTTDAGTLRVTLSSDSTGQVKLAAGSHVITDTGSTTAVTGNVTVVQSTAANLNATVTGTVTTTPPANASTNITQVGGAALTEGQKTMANSVPVVIASDQSAIAVTGTITTSPNVNVHDGSGNTIASTGTSLNVDVTNTVPVTLASTTITGTVAVTESGTWNVGVNNFPATQPVSGTVTVVQPTGTNLHVVNDASSAVIGHVITDTGSTTAVTGNVTVVQPTGTNLHVVNDASSAVIGHVITYTGSTTEVTGTVAVTESGTWTVQPGNTANTTPWLVTQAPATSGGVSTNVQQSLTSSALVKGSAGQKYGYEVYNPNASAVYVFFYNTTSAPTIGSTTNLLTQMGIPSLSGAIFNHTIGIPFSTGIYVAVSTSPTSAAAPGSGLTITTLYD